MRKKGKIVRMIALSFIVILLIENGGIIKIQATAKKENYVMGEVAENTVLSNPQKDNTGIVRYDCIHFGNYPQSDSSGKIKEPIKWRVLSVNGNDAFLIADCNLDVYPYNNTDEEVTWENCTMRSWLNGYDSTTNVCEIDYSNNSFISEAFNEVERKAILETVVKSNELEGNGDTRDKIFLLSIAETLNSTYGFLEDIDEYDSAKKRKNTAYVMAGGTIKSEYMNDVGKNDWWWLRTKGEVSNYAAFVNTFACTDKNGSVVDDDSIAVCPALHLNLSQADVWNYAGTINSDGSSVGEENIIIPTVTKIITPTKTPIESAPTFDLHTYRANFFLDDTYPITIGLNNDLSSTTPCNILIPLLQENGFQNSVLAWETVCGVMDAVDSPSSLGEFVMQEKDLYSAIILTTLEVSMESDISESCKDVIKDSQDMVSSVKKIMQEQYNFNVANDNEFKNLTEEQKNKLIEITGAYFEEDFDKDLKSMNKVFSNMSNFLDAADCIETYAANLASAYEMAKMSESMKTVVRTMYDNCPESKRALKSALKDCVQIIDDGTENFMNEIVSNTTVVIGTEVTKYLVDTMWDKITERISFTNPGLAIMVGTYKANKLVLDMVLKTDATSEQYMDMLAISDIEELGISALQTLKTNYQKQPTTENAEAFLSAVDFVYSCYDYDCVSAYKFVDVLDQSVANMLITLFKKNNNAEVKAAIKGFQSSYYTSHESILTSWINELEVDYPNTGIYEKYNYLLDESLQRTVTKKYGVACPVDVYVYDKNSNLVAYVVDNKTYASGDITVMLKNHAKTLYFYNDEEYRMEYVGNDHGSMDVEVMKYDGTENVTDQVNYYDIPLEAGLSYETMTVGDSVSSTIPALSEKNGDSLIPNLDLTKVQENGQKYHISIEFGNIVTEEGYLFETEAYENQKVTVSAYVPNGYEFVKWISNNGDNVFKDVNSVITTVKVSNGDMKITAELKAIGMEKPTVEPSKTPEIKITEMPINIQPTVTSTPKVGSKVKDTSSNGEYKVKDGKTVEYVKPIKQKATVKIPQTITIGNTKYKVTSIAKNAFKNNKKLTKVTIGSNITTIGASAFRGCSKLKTVSIGKNVTTIGDKAFYKCTALSKITIPAKVNKIGKQAFYGCKKLKNITIKTTKLTSKNIGSKAFKGIYSKVKIKVPKSKVNAYKKLLKSKGVGSKAVIKK